jgi:hypothetical protein
MSSTLLLSPPMMRRKKVIERGLDRDLSRITGFPLGSNRAPSWESKNVLQIQSVEAAFNVNC